MNATSNRGDAPVDWVTWLSGYFEDTGQVNQRLEWIERECILVGSPPICSALPPCTAVLFNIVRVDLKLDSFRVGGGDSEDDADDKIDTSKGDRALRKAALLRLADAAGISWDGKSSGRADDGRDPHYVHWHAAGGRRDLTGTAQLINGDKQIDLREGSPRLQRILASVHERDRTGKPRNDEQIGFIQERLVRDARMDILERAVTGAKCRAIREALGLRAYSVNELGLLFVVPRIVITGRHSDPEIERAITTQFVAGFLAGGSALFGDAPARPKALTATSPAPRLAPPAQVANVSLGSDDRDPQEESPIDAEGTEIGCEYCGALDGLQLVATKTGDVYVCDNSECYDHAQSGVSVQGSSQVRPPSHAPATSRPRSTPPPPPARPASPPTRGGSRPTGAPPAPPPRSPSPAAGGGAGRGRDNVPLSGHVLPARPGDTPTPIEHASMKRLDYWIDKIGRGLQEGTTALRFQGKDKALLAALRNEKACRPGGGVPH